MSAQITGMQITGFRTRTVDAWVFECCRATVVVLGAWRVPRKCPICGGTVEPSRARASAKVRFVEDKEKEAPHA